MRYNHKKCRGKSKCFSLGMRAMGYGKHLHLGIG